MAGEAAERNLGLLVRLKMHPREQTASWGASNTIDWEKTARFDQSSTSSGYELGEEMSLSARKCRISVWCCYLCMSHAQSLYLALSSFSFIIELQPQTLSATCSVCYRQFFN